MMNPAKLLTLKKEYTAFSQRHPKFMQFIITLIQNGVGVGSVIDVTVTMPDGRNWTSNMKVTEEDVEFIKGFKDMM